MTREDVLSRFPEGSVYYLPLLLGMELKLTKSETFGLSWQDVDLARGIVRVNNVAYYNRFDNYIYFFKSVKSNTSNLTIPAQNALKRAKKRVNYNRGTNTKQTYTVRVNGQLRGPYEQWPRRHGNLCDELIPVCARQDGTYISPQGINYVARILQGKQGRFNAPDSNWKWEDLWVL
jgi:hypothetical protein